MPRRKPLRERAADWFADLLGLDGGETATTTTDEDGFVWEDVSSSNVEAVGWNGQFGLLRIRFGVDKPAVTYEYGPDFPVRVYRALMDAPSKGTFVWEEIRNFGADDRYPYSRV
ncbi:MAG TPA: KTSC domain-containing protein [bacterium]|nr:KTSC domain-containing protein [bacterium]